MHNTQACTHITTPIQPHTHRTQCWRHSTVCPESSMVWTSCACGRICWLAGVACTGRPSSQPALQHQRCMRRLGGWHAVTLAAHGWLLHCQACWGRWCLRYISTKQRRREWVDGGMGGHMRARMHAPPSCHCGICRGRPATTSRGTCSIQVGVPAASKQASAARRLSCVSAGTPTV